MEQADEFGEFQDSESTGFWEQPPKEHDSFPQPSICSTTANHTDIDGQMVSTAQIEASSAELGNMNKQSSWFSSQDFVMASLHHDKDALDRLREALNGLNQNPNNQDNMDKKTLFRVDDMVQRAIDRLRPVKSLQDALLKFSANLGQNSRPNLNLNMKT
jgi:hypothetical protein